MRLGRGVLVLLPHFDRLVRLHGDQAGSRAVKRRGKYASLRLHRTRLNLGRRLLEVVPALVIPEVQRPVVTAAHHHVVLVHRERVHDRLLLRQHVVHEPAVGQRKLFDVIRRRRQERKLPGVQRERPHALLVVRQSVLALTRGEIPELHRAVVRAGDHLRVVLLRHDGPDGVVVAGEAKHLRLGPHVPHPARAVPAASHQHVQRGVQRERVHAGEVTVVVADHLVVLQVPALDHLVEAAREHVGVPVAHRQAHHLLDVTRQRQLELPGGEVPDLNRAIRGSGREPLVGGIHRDASNPTQVARDDAVELPRCVPWGLRPLAREPRDDLRAVVVHLLRLRHDRSGLALELDDGVGAGARLFLLAVVD
mmetsp:Transcript_9728/g.39391  ORF Transcript_9728/g.39391 Transcript_9728/m.39391 type:complete len:365 (+) Transcript_9728:110-1204(+)